MCIYVCMYIPPRLRTRRTARPPWPEPRPPPAGDVKTWLE